MKIFTKKVLIPLLMVALIVAYLIFANAFIYWRIDHGNLPKVNFSAVTEIKNSSTTITTTLVYASLGDSLTYGAGANNYNESYPYLVAQKLTKNYSTVVLKNFSYQGATTDNIIKDLLPNIASSNPDVVTILAGVNDAHNFVSAEKFKNNYETILKILATQTQAKIYAISIPKIGSNSIYLPPFNFYFSGKIDQYNKIIKDLTVKYQVKYIDITIPTLNWVYSDGVNYSADSFHPSAAGYKIFSDLIYDSFSR